MADKTTLSIITVILTILLVFIYFKIPNKKISAGSYYMGFYYSRAIGNFIDRISLKYVVDFIYFELIDFPIFNIADCYLTVSCVLLLILGLFYYKDDDFEFLESIFKIGKRKEKDLENKE